MRVSLADRKECRTNTTGFGPEWRSNTCRVEGGRKLEKGKEDEGEEKKNSRYPRYSLIQMQIIVLFVPQHFYGKYSSFNEMG